jgi:hypothetical protein
MRRIVNKLKYDEIFPYEKFAGGEKNGDKWR